MFTLDNSLGDSFKKKQLNKTMAAGSKGMDGWF